MRILRYNFTILNHRQTGMSRGSSGKHGSLPHACLGASIKDHTFRKG
jgi:hypothetical protein